MIDIKSIKAAAEAAESRNWAHGANPATVIVLCDEVERLRDTLKETGLFLHHCWCDVQMNEYSFDKLNKTMELVDNTLKDKQ